MTEELLAEAAGAQPSILYVAVIGTADMKSRSYNGGLSAFTGYDRDAVISEAIEKAREYNLQNNGRRGYHVLVGELTARAVSPVKYELVTL